MYPTKSFSILAIILGLFSINTSFAEVYISPSAHGCNGVGGSSLCRRCSGEKAKTNLEIADATLAKLTSSVEFSEAETFKKEAKRIAGIRDLQLKFEAYLSLVDVKNNVDELSRFVGARSVSPYLAVFAKRLELNPVQAEVALMAIQNALKNNLHGKDRSLVERSAK